MLTKDLWNELEVKWPKAYVPLHSDVQTHVLLQILGRLDPTTGPEEGQSLYTTGDITNKNFWKDRRQQVRHSRSQSNM